MADTGAERPRGWYQDPNDPEHEALWNGSVWTGARRAKRGTSAARLRRIATLVGLAFLVPVVLFTFLPTKAAGFDCGTWLSRNHPVTTGTSDSVLADTTAFVVDNQCQDKLDNRRLIALVLIGVGVVARFGIPAVARA